MFFNNKKKIEQDIKLDFSDVLIRPRVSTNKLTRAGINIEKKFLNYSGSPIIVANMPAIGNYSFLNAIQNEDVIVFMYKDKSLEYHLSHLPKVKNLKQVGITTGIKANEIQKVIDIYNEHRIGFINLDIANVYANSKQIFQASEKLKKLCPNSILSVGNICSPELVAPLSQAGADLVKVGVGSGAACKTRSVVGVGYPQISALLEVFEQSVKTKLGIISDGGCSSFGDVCKALGAGADFVMLGSMFANSFECENIVTIEGKKYVNFWGLGSQKQYDLTNPSEKEYRPNEGRNLMVPCETSALETIRELKGSLRSGCTYVGSDDINHFWQKVQFIRTNNQMNRTMEKYEAN